MRASCDLAREAEENPHLALVERRAPEELAQRQHDVRRVVRYEKANLQEGALQMLEHALDLGSRSRRPALGFVGNGPGCAAQLVTTNQDGLGEVEGRIRRIGVDADQALAVLRPVRQPVILDRTAARRFLGCSKLQSRRDQILMREIHRDVVPTTNWQSATAAARVN
jgi:hypothetical protein